ncbi:importin [Vairimorpha necatrix]|uniref:Importin n=1 Tax=Vairimorpha necatrix TaxID=6039 RepID=A0AAX4JE39_9MICR
MNSEIKEIFRNTLNPDIVARTKSEERLNQLQKDYNFLLSLPTTFMKDSDLMIKKTSSLFFKNAVISEWSNLEFEHTKKIIISNLVDFFMSSDENNIVSYNGILIHIYNKEPSNVTNELLTNVSNMIKSYDMLQFTVALNIIEQIFHAEKIKYNLEDILELIYKTSGQELLTNLHTVISKNDYKTASGILRFISKSYNYYSIPEFLQRLDVFSYVINISTEILKIQNNSDFYFMKTKKWTAFFLFKAANKGVKKFYKNEEMSKFIIVPDRFSYIYEVFLSQLKMEKFGNKSEPVEMYAVEFMTLCASDKETYKFMEKDLIWLITEYILYMHELNENEEDDFQNDPEKFLREKYHYFGYDIRNECGTLFTEIMKTLKHTEQGMNWICQFFIQNLENAKKNPVAENLKKSYGIYFLLSHVTHTIFKSSKSSFENILTNYVFYDIKYGNLIMKSQACYLLSFIEEQVTVSQNLLDAIGDVINIVRGKHPILSVDSTLAMNFFISNKDLTKYVSVYIGELVQSVLTLSANYDIEPLTYLLDNIMQSFTNEIAVFAPDLVRSMGNLILSHLANEQSESDDKMMVISGFLRNVETVINTENHPQELTLRLYQNFYNVLEIIIREKKDNFYQEVLDIINCFFYSITTFDNSMWNLFTLILNLPIEDILVYPNEISEIIDNVVCNGKEVVLDNYILDKILSFSVKLCIADEDGMYDEDFISGCKIMETLLLNVGEKLFSLYPEKLDIFIKLIAEAIPLLEEDSSAIIYGLEIIMNCFYILPLETLQILKLRGFDGIFFNRLYEKRKEFCRVHDKKICLRFLGKLFSLPQTNIQVRLNIEKIAKSFLTIFCTLPDAIEARNKLFTKKDKSSEESEESAEYESEEYNDLEEDIYFSSILDKFDPYPYIYNIFASASQNTIGNLVISSMSKEQMNKIQDVFTNKSKIQQKF